jgi:hypothetical protein
MKWDESGFLNNIHWNCRNHCSNRFRYWNYMETNEKKG